MSTPDKKTPAWLVERLAQGELDAETAAGLRARLEAEGRSPEDVLATLARADAETLAAHPPARVAAEVHRRAGLNRSVSTPRPQSQTRSRPRESRSAAVMLDGARVRPAALCISRSQRQANASVARPR